MRKITRLPREELDKLRLSLLRRQIYHARINVPFYIKSFRESGLDTCAINKLSDLSRYNLIYKSDIQNQTDCFISRNVNKKLFPKSHTSGSSGQPSWTHYDWASWIRKKYLSKLRARFECGMNIGDRVAIFECTDDAKKNHVKPLSRRLSRHLFIKNFSIFTSLEKVLAEIIAFNPKVIYSSPGHLFELARHIESKRLKIPGLRVIFTSSEYLELPTRNYISMVFACPVYDIYGSTEFKEVAWECPSCEGYHINEDEVFVEVLNDGQPARMGEVGDIVLTDLRNKVMPLIRYSIGDKGMLIDKQCSCGMTFGLMKPCAGRSSEYIKLPNGQKLSPYLFTTSIEKIQGLLHYQIVQTEAAEIEVNIVLREACNDVASKEIRDILILATKKMMNINVNIREKIIVEDNGKHKVVRNLYSQ